jgi:cell wall-associated NlpC family hydrolase
MINSVQLYKKNLLLAQNIRTMKQGICSLSLLPLRSEPSSKSEMVSQLLFGEVFTILEEKEEWVFIENHSDNYRGWLNFLQVDLISEKPNESKVLNTFPFISAINLQSKEPLLLPTASYLHDFKMVENQTCFKQNGIQYLVQTESLIDSFETINNVLDLAIKFLNVPYLWGGKSAFGIDCSGFTQVVFKTIGFQLPRDAWQQATIGESKTFIEEISPGDLLFFGDQPEKITHVGIALGGNKIIHASGKVRIDAFDSYGIFNIESKKHTHVLRNIRSISQKH